MINNVCCGLILLIIRRWAILMEKTQSFYMTKIMSRSVIIVDNINVADIDHLTKVAAPAIVIERIFFFMSNYLSLKFHTFLKVREMITRVVKPYAEWSTTKEFNQITYL